MNAKHTPGEWYSKETSSGQALIISEHNGHNVAVAYAPEDGPLLASAPALLEACKNYVYGHKDARECEAEMKAAIAKAEGGE
jgi:hypothetical protein